MPTAIREALRRLKRRRLERLRDAARGEEIKRRNADLNWRELWHGCTALRSYPRHVQVGTNTGCNLRCIFCRLSAEETREQLRQLPAEAREIAPGVLERVLELMPYPEMMTLAPLGEPLLYSKLGRMLERHAELGCHNLAITTNANLIDDERARMIVEAGVCHLFVSIDTCDPALYAQMRVGASLDKAVAALEAINRWKERRQSHLPTMTLASTFMERNVRHMPDLLEFAVRHGFETFSVQLMEAVNPALEPEFLGHHVDLARDMVRETMHRAEGRKIGVRVHMALDNLLAFGSTGNASATVTTPLQLIQKCTDPWGYLVINTDGGCNPCCWTGIGFGNLAQSDFDAVWNSDVAVRMRRDFLRNHIPDGCRNRFCGVDLDHAGTLGE